MSTVKIRAGSLFRNLPARIGAWEAAFNTDGLFSAGCLFSSTPHKSDRSCTGCAQEGNPWVLRQASLRVQSRNEENCLESGMTQALKAPADVCPLCGGTGWKTASPVGNAPPNGSKERQVTRCDCRLLERARLLLAAARIPRRYEHCELSSFTTDFPGAHPSLALA